MSNITEQDSLLYVPRNREKRPRVYAASFAGFLNAPQTPIDIFEGVTIKNAAYQYAAQYAAHAFYGLDWEADVEIPIDADETRYTAYHDCQHVDNALIVVTEPANINEQSDIDSRLFINDTDVMLGMVNLIECNPDGEDLCLMRACELGDDAVEQCRRNTADIDRNALLKKTEEKMNGRVDDILKHHYEKYERYKLTAAQIELQSVQYLAVLVPLIRVDYTYGGGDYVCWLNAHSQSTALLLDRKYLTSGTRPVDENKPSGLFGKVKNAAVKIKTKNDRKESHTDRFAECFEQFLGK